MNVKREVYAFSW